MVVTSLTLLNYATPQRKGLARRNLRETIKKIGSKWHGLINNRPDVDEPALTEAIARQAERVGDSSEPVARQLGCSGDSGASWYKDTFPRRACGGNMKAARSPGST